jgi:hypothetical protein
MRSHRLRDRMRSIRRRNGFCELRRAPGLKPLILRRVYRGLKPAATPAQLPPSPGDIDALADPLRIGYLLHHKVRNVRAGD